MTPRNLPCIGKIIYTNTHAFSEVCSCRTGYPNWVYERRYIVEKLYNHLWDKEKVYFGKRVEKIEHSQDGVKVFCTDGSDFSGHIVVGQDGVHSTVRKEMWRLADDSAEPFSEKEKDCECAAELALNVWS
jgi:2-polyprenyl-6-methoxyphenol hydroxylase-like FAD-dependent oxidoreductase